jgi:2-dehydropantoate 2-reductase
MKTLIIGMGALGGLIAARFRAAGLPDWLATRDADQSDRLRASGLKVTGIGGAVTVQATAIGPLDASAADDKFELVLFGHQGSRCDRGGAQAIRSARAIHHAAADPEWRRSPDACGAIGEVRTWRVSNLGATIEAPGKYEQRNAGHLLIGEFAGGESEQIERVHRWLERAVEVRATRNLRGAVWSKLLLNCSVTTIGAIAGGTMRG